MNIFALARAAREAAEMHCDQHAGKMIVETAQMLYAHLHAIGVELPPDVAAYKPAYCNHPCTLWLHGGRAHFFWLLELGLWLCTVYTQRYGKTHGTELRLRHMAKHVCAKALPKTCGSKAWLRRLAKRGIKPALVRSCAAKVAIGSPPAGCSFGVACMADDTVSLEPNSKGRIDLVKTYRSFYVFKNAVMFRMKWRKTCKPPRKLRRCMGWECAQYNSKVGE